MALYLSDIASEANLNPGGDATCTESSTGTFVLGDKVGVSVSIRIQSFQTGLWWSDGLENGINNVSARDKKKKTSAMILRHTNNP